MRISRKCVFEGASVFRLSPCRDSDHPLPRCTKTCTSGYHHLCVEQCDPRLSLAPTFLPSCIRHKRCSLVLQGTWLLLSATCFHSHACQSSSYHHDAIRCVHYNSAVRMAPHAGTPDVHMGLVLCLALASRSLLLCTGCGERIKPAPAPKKQRKKPAGTISSRPSTILCSLIISHLFLKNITVF